jgi:hypothetical protein
MHIHTYPHIYIQINRTSVSSEDGNIGDSHQGAKSGRTDAQASASAVGETEAKRGVQIRPTMEAKETYLSAVGETEGNMELLFQSKFGITLVMSSEVCVYTLTSLSLSLSFSLSLCLSLSHTHTRVKSQSLLVIMY